MRSDVVVREVDNMFVLGLGKDPEFGADVSTAAGREVGWKCDEGLLRVMC